MPVTGCGLGFGGGPSGGHGCGAAVPGICNQRQQNRGENLRVREREGQGDVEREGMGVTEGSRGGVSVQSAPL